MPAGGATAVGDEGCLNCRSAARGRLTSFSLFFRSAFTPQFHHHHHHQESMGKPKGPKGPEVGIAFPIDKKGGR